MSTSLLTTVDERDLLLRLSALMTKADDGDKSAQESRSHKYGIGVKEGGNVTKPSQWSSVPDSEWGDPVFSMAA